MHTLFISTYIYFCYNITPTCFGGHAAIIRGHQRSQAPFCIQQLYNLTFKKHSDVRMFECFLNVIYYDCWMRNGDCYLWCPLMMVAWPPKCVEVILIRIYTYKRCLHLFAACMLGIKPLVCKFNLLKPSGNFTYDQV
jgi:hypothetical protein